jgi:hypothetical protein
MAESVKEVQVIWRRKVCSYDAHSQTLPLTSSLN